MYEKLPPIDWAHPYVIAGVAVAVFVFLAMVAWKSLRRKKPLAERTPPNLSIAVANLDPTGPQGLHTYLEVYCVPLRLAVLVLAPAGRGNRLPAAARIPAVIETLIPGLATIYQVHAPLLRLWPAQLSSHGFTNSFFSNVKLPGDHGKGTRWSSVAGKFAPFDHQYLIGMLCVADSENGLGELTIEHPGQWLDIVRVKRRESPS